MKAKQVIKESKRQFATYRLNVSENELVILLGIIQEHQDNYAHRLAGRHDKTVRKMQAKMSDALNEILE